MPRPQTALKDYLDSINPHSSATVELYLKNGEFYFLTNADFNLSIEGYPEPFKPGLERVGEIEENLGRATSGVSLKIANEYEGDPHFWHKMDARDDNPLLDADVVIKVFRRDGETAWQYESHDYYFTGKLATTDSKESFEQDRETKSGVLRRWIEMEIVLDTTAAGICLATKTLSAANGFVTSEAADVSTIPTGTANTVGGSIIGSDIDIEGRPRDCFIAGTLVSTPKGQVPIERIKKDDEVYSFNPQTFQIETDIVIATISKTAENYLEINFGASGKVCCTDRHRFLFDAAYWIEAANLDEGETVFVESGAGLVESSEIETIKRIPQKTGVFNLTVQKNQTYFANNFAVHNTKRNPYDDQDLIGIEVRNF